MTEPTDRERELVRRLLGSDRAINADLLEKIAAAVRAEGPSRPNLPRLFEADDWLWVAQCLGHVGTSLFRKEDHERQQHLDRIIAKILEYRAEDVRRERSE